MATKLVGFFVYFVGGVAAGAFDCLLKRCSIAGMNYNVQSFW